MVVSIEIVPVSESLVMYGEADPTSAYSLSGHLSISLSSPSSMFDRRRTSRVLLQSILLTFEGQTEILTPHTGYSSARICSITREIAPSDSIELTNEGHEDSEQPCVWNVVFDVPIPGWLPETATFGEEDFGVRYTLYAEAKFVHLDDHQSGSWSLSTFCSPFRSRQRHTYTAKPVVVRRIFSLTDDALNLSRTIRTYLVTPPISACPDSDQPRIPCDILSNIQVLASVPAYVDVKDEDVTLTIRMRTKGLDISSCERLRITAIAADIVQREKYRRRASSEYTSRNPLPRRSQQPPNLPLRDPHPFSNVYNLGLCMSESVDATARVFSLLPPGESRPHSLGDDNYPFKNDADGSSSPTWYTLETTIPFLHRAAMQGKLDEKSNEWAGFPILRPSTSSPLINVRHELSIRLACSYDIPESDVVASEQLTFVIPVRFAHFAADPESCCSSDSLVPDAGAALCGPSLPPSSLYAQNLPAYSQLYDHNGDRKIDYSVPLPLYTPHPPSHQTLFDDVESKDFDGRQPLLSSEFSS